MNAKTAKALRRMVRASMKPGTPEHRLLAKPIKVERDGTLVTVYSAVNAKGSERGMYLTKKAYEEHPEVRAEVARQLSDIKGYRRMLEHERRSGGPLFDQPRGG